MEFSDSINNALLKSSSLSASSSFHVLEGMRWGVLIQHPLSEK